MSNSRDLDFRILTKKHKTLQNSIIFTYTACMSYVIGDD